VRKQRKKKRGEKRKRRRKKEPHPRARGENERNHLQMSSGGLVRRDCLFLVSKFLLLELMPLFDVVVVDVGVLGKVKVTRKPR